MLTLEYNRPEVAGGGATKSFGAISGWGNLGKDGWNAYIAVDHRAKSALFQQARPDLFEPEQLRALSLWLLPDNTNPSPIANVGVARTANSNYNPACATGCLEPYARPTLGATSVSLAAGILARRHRKAL